MARYKSETYKGYKITFVYHNGLIWSRALSLTRQFLSSGKTKAEAFKGAKGSIRTILAVSK